MFHGAIIENRLISSSKLLAANITTQALLYNNISCFEEENYPAVHVTALFQFVSIILLMCVELRLTSSLLLSRLTDTTFTVN